MGDLAVTRPRSSRLFGPLDLDADINRLHNVYYKVLLPTPASHLLNLHVLDCTVDLLTFSGLCASTAEATLSDTSSLLLTETLSS